MIRNIGRLVCWVVVRVMVEQRSVTQLLMSSKVGGVIAVECTATIRWNRVSKV